MSFEADSRVYLIRFAVLVVLAGGCGSVMAQHAESKASNERFDPPAAQQQAPAERRAPEVSKETAERITRDGREMTISLDLRAGFMSETDFDSLSGGTIESTTVGGDLGFLVPIGDRAQLLLKFGADVTNYDITPLAGTAGTTASTVGTQFDTVTQYGFDGLYSRAIDDRRSFFIGGGIGVAAEGGASDAIVWNAVGGFAVQINDRLKLGLGVGVYSRIEDNVRVVPLPQIHFQIDDRWSIQSMGIGGKLDYKWNDDLSMGILGQFDGSSFRIDGDNTLVPDGAVTMTGFPVSYYVDYSGGGDGGARVSVFAQAGVVLGGQMEILNSSGLTVVDEDIDPGVFAAVGVRIEF